MKNIIVKLQFIIIVLLIVWIYRQNALLKENKLKIDIIDSKSMNENVNNVDSLLVALYSNGNSQSYQDLHIHYLNNPPLDFIGVAIIMSNKYNKKEAYVNVYDQLYLFNMMVTGKREDFVLNGLDTLTKKIAFAALLKAYEMGDINAKNINNNIRKQVNKDVYQLLKEISPN